MLEPHYLERVTDSGDQHFSTSSKTPIRPDAFELSDEEKITRIAHHFEQIMQTLGLDLTDDSLAGTPHRVAKMYVQELFSGLNPENAPRISLFENQYHYRQMLVERDITVQSVCEHHFVPIIGRAHVAYISSGKVIGLSKINRIVRHYCRRPQVQERLTVEIADALCEALDTPDVAVLIDAKHYCVIMRGIEDQASSTVTAEYRGRFRSETTRADFLNYLNL
jgi:GTP cyclohydrolase I